ncbi:MAG: hypothetical protein PWP64_468 [Candidatus Cloacimonadota bacterium]|nr:hypothetical protein [Candidatus Cloacimonadota bacterium]
MKKILILCLMLSIVIILTADTVALLSASKGKVELVRSKKSIAFTNGELLKNRDILRTGPESFAAYKYIDASALVKLFANSVVTIYGDKSGDKLSKRVNVKKGSVLSSIKSGSGAFTVQTPTTVASVKGTEFVTRVDENGNSMFIVTEGEVELRVMSSDERASVGKGKTAIINSDSELFLRETSNEDLSRIEQIELESTQTREKTIIRIPVMDQAGNTKYIEISY